MRLTALTAGAICIAFLLGCSQAAAPTSTPNTKDAAVTIPQLNPTPLEAENNRICKKMYGIPCNAIPHLPGPMNATALGEPQACVNEVVAKFELGQWVADNKYQNPKTRERYGDLCIAVSI